MKTLSKLLFTLIITVLSGNLLFAQTNDDASLVKQGIALNDAGKYDEAIEKYAAALKINPDNFQADFEMAYTLYTSGKSKDAIPYLEVIIKSSASKYESYELLASIYDDNGDQAKAIELYKKGIAEKPNFERLHFNLGLTYLRAKKYPEAESEAIESIKLDQTHASAQRLYGLATLAQNKRLCALMAFCNFLLLEPRTARSTEIYGYLDKVLNAAADQKTIFIETDKVNGISPMSMASSSIVLAATAKKEFEKQNIGTAVDRLNNELNMIFTSTAQQAEKVTDKDFFWKFYAGFFGQLSKSGNMPAFTRYISLSAYTDENVAWLKEHKQELDAFDVWLRSQQRSF
jgi:tetratricopeptide (TPR) repeat protein